MKLFRDILENISAVRFGTWARLLALLLSFANTALNAMGKNPLSISEDEAYQALSLIVAAVCTVAAYWKNNSFTGAAQAADKVLEDRRTGA
ncbi:MAG: SPP1 phage holin family protein [Oscillospiraceae bacterium]|jgi:SPP1 family holin|nr:SPP1 phage holin family protein [Oscillospiraceae bacterium]